MFIQARQTILCIADLSERANKCDKISFDDVIFAFRRIISGLALLSDVMFILLFLELSIKMLSTGSY